MDFSPWKSWNLTRPFFLLQQLFSSSFPPLFSQSFNSKKKQFFTFFTVFFLSHSFHYFFQSFHIFSPFVTVFIVFHHFHICSTCFPFFHLFKTCQTFCIRATMCKHREIWCLPYEALQASATTLVSQRWIFALIYAPWFENFSGSTLVPNQR